MWLSKWGEPREGLAKFYYSNYNLAITGNYKAGKKEGIWEFYDEKGEFKKPSAKGIESIIKTEDTVNIFSEYVKDLEENIKKEPKFDEVDKSAEGLVQSLNNEKNVITEIVDYYKNKKVGRRFR